MRALAAGALALALVPGAALTAAAECRQALVLALDVSGSVDATEYGLQLQGLAAALADPEVAQALFAMPGAAVDLAVFEWSDSDHARIILDWTTLADPAALQGAVATIAGMLRQPAPPSTAIGSAMEFGAAKLAERPQCWRQVLDISGDGTSNSGPRPQDVRGGAGFAGIVINALVVGSDSRRGPGPRQAESDGLRGYFEAWVIHGPDAFAETAAGYGDYGRAMRRKLLRELQILPVAWTAAP